MTGSHGYKKILGPEDDRSLTRSVWVPAPVSAGAAG